MVRIRPRSPASSARSISTRQAFTQAFTLAFTQAFTLVEVVVTVILITILAAMVIPRYATANNRYRAAAAARRVAADLIFAQARARATSTYRIVSFNSATETYQILAEPDPITGAANYTVDLTQPPYNCAISTASFGGAATVSFNGYGMTSSGGSVVITSGSATSTATVDAINGGVTIQ